MATCEQVKIQCPFCPWCKRTLHFPDHILTRHVSEIRIRPIPTDHCIYASVTKNKDDIEFCACLSCGKGAMGDGTAGNTARWISMHSKKAECKKAHTKALIHFNKKREMKPPPDPVKTVTPDPPIPDQQQQQQPPPVTSTATGYVYCFANESMPGILKIGMTTRTPFERLEEANTADTWKPPTPYTVELAKRVSDPKCKENTIHKLLEKYSEKIHDRREFFRISVDDVRLFFDLMDGEYWTTSPTQEKSKHKRKNKKKAPVVPKN